MSAKHLTESGWKDFAKSRDLKDAAMLKALAAFGKSAAKGVWEQRATLDEVYKQSELLLKVTKADRDAQKYISELQREIDLTRANLAKAEKGEKAAAAAAAAQEDDDDSPALLSSKMLVHFKALNSDPSATRPFVIGMLGPKVAVLVHKTTIGASHKKLVAEQLGGSGAKFYYGDCRFEKGAYTFVMDKSIGGLAAKLSKALFEQVGKKLKVRVRGSDPSDVDEEEDDKPAPAAKKETPAADKAPSRPNVPPAADGATGKPAAGAIPTPPPFPAKKAPAKVLSGAAPAKAPAGGPAAPGGAAVADEDSDDSQLERLNAWLKDNKSKVEQVAKAAGDKGKPLSLKLSEAGALYRQKRVGMLADAVDDIEAMMAKLQAASTPAGPTADSGGGADGQPAPAAKPGATAPLSPRAKKLMDTLTALAPKVAARMGAEKEPEARKRVRDANNHVHKQITLGRLAGAEAALRSLIRYLKTPVEE